MKHLLLLSLLSISGKFATAQQVHDIRTSRYEKEIIQLLRKQQSLEIAEQKPTGLKQRVIAQTNRSSTQNDSTAFTFSDMRGSRFDYNQNNYDRTLENVMVPNAYSLLADSISFYVNDTLKYIDNAYYRADNKTDSFFAKLYNEYFPIDSLKQINVYDNSGVVDHSYYFEYYPVTNDTSGLFQYNYDITYTKKLVDTNWTKESGNWLIGTVVNYHFHANGQLDTITIWANISGALSIRERTIFTYYPNGTLRTSIDTAYQDGTFFRSIIDTFGYTSGIEYCTLSQTVQVYDFGTGPQISYNRVERYPGANGNPDSVKYYSKSTSAANWIPQSVYRYTYNSYDNPEEILIFNSSNSSGIPDKQSKFYYELYDDGLSVSTLNREPDFGIFPNPCTNELSISKTNKNAVGQYKVCILNILGQEVLCSTWETNRKPVLRLNAGNLISGTYFVVIRDERGRIRTKRFIKR